MGSTIVGRTGFDLTKVYHVVITPGGRSSPQEVKLDLPLDVDILFHDHVTIDSLGCQRKPASCRWVLAAGSWPLGPVVARGGLWASAQGRQPAR
jgi:hypothetical protein